MARGAAALLPTDGVAVPVLVPARLAEPFPAGHRPGAGGGAGRPTGEARPREESPDGFFAIRFLNVAAAPDGVLEAHPVAGGPGSAAVAACNGWYMMPTGPGARRAEPGDVIMVELR